MHEAGAKNAMGDRLSLRLLGEFGVWRGEVPVAITSRKNRALLAVLALAPNHTATRERMAGLLWADRQDEQARASLRQALAVLRKDIGDPQAEVLVAREEHLRLNPAAVTSDVAEFLRLGRSRVPGDLAAAVALWGGDLLADLGGRDEGLENWLGFERARLRQEAVGIFEALAGTQAGEEAVATAARLLEFDSLREASHRTLMRTLARAGRAADAIRQFEALKQLLRDELGVAPSPDSAALAADIAAGRVPADAGAAQPGRRRPAGPLPTLAVLPFKELSAEPDRGFLAEGITDDLITELSRFRSFQVFARRSSFAVSPSADAAGAELGATYVLEGSVRTHGPRLRVTAQLRTAEGGEQVWGERYDRDLTDILAVQEEVACAIAGTLAVEMDDRELDQTRSRHLDDFRAYEHWLEGKRALWTEGASNLQARAQFARAAELDPGFARAFAGMAVTYVEEAVQFPPEAEFRAALDRGLACAQEAVRLDKAECLGHAALGWVHLYRGDYELSLGHVRQALRLNPNDADMLANAAYVLSLGGDAAEGVRSGKAAMRLNPRFPDWYPSFLCTALFLARRLDEMIELRAKVPATFYDSRFFGAAALAHLGRVDEARDWAAQAVERLAARVGPDRMQAKGCVQLLLDNNPMRNPGDRAFFAEGLRRAGVPG